MGDCSRTYVLDGPFYIAEVLIEKLDPGVGDVYGGQLFAFSFTSCAGSQVTNCCCR